MPTEQNYRVLVRVLCGSVCMCVCVFKCVFLHDKTKRNRSRNNLPLTHFI